MPPDDNVSINSSSTVESFKGGTVTIKGILVTAEGEHPIEQTFEIVGNYMLNSERDLRREGNTFVSRTGRIKHSLTWETRDSIRRGQ